MGVEMVASDGDEGGDGGLPMAWIIIVSTLSGENLSLCRQRL